MPHASRSRRRYLPQRRLVMRDPHHAHDLVGKAEPDLVDVPHVDARAAPRRGWKSRNLRTNRRRVLAPSDFCDRKGNPAAPAERGQRGSSGCRPSHGRPTEWLESPSPRPLTAAHAQAHRLRRAALHRARSGLMPPVRAGQPLRAGQPVQPRRAEQPQAPLELGRDRGPAARLGARPATRGRDRRHPERLVPPGLLRRRPRPRVHGSLPALDQLLRDRGAPGAHPERRSARRRRRRAHGRDPARRLGVRLLAGPGQARRWRHVAGQPRRAHARSTATG